MKRSLVIFVFLLHSLSCGAQEKIELVVASGYDIITDVCFSNNNKLVGKLFSDKASVWDVATGRMIRNVIYTDDQGFGADTIWFSEDDQYLRISSQSTNDYYQVDVFTGESTLIKGEPFDPVGFEYRLPAIAKTSMFLADASRRQMKIPAPDGKIRLHLKKEKEKDAMPGVVFDKIAYNLIDDQGVSHRVDTGFVSYYTFSANSELLFLNGGIYDVSTGRLVSKGPPPSYSGSGVAFVPGTHIPVTCGTKSVRFWDIPDVRDVDLDWAVDFAAVPGYKQVLVEQLNKKAKKKIYSVVDLEQKKVVSKFNLKEFNTMLTDVDFEAKRAALYKYDYNLKNPSKYKYEIEILDGKSGKVVHKIPNAMRATFTSDPNIMMVDSAGMGSYRYNLKTKKREKFPTDEYTISTIARHVSNDRQYLVGVNYKYVDTVFYYELCAWNLSTGKIDFRANMGDSNFPMCVDISKDHKYMALGVNEGNAIKIFDFETGEEIYTLKGHMMTLAKVVISDDRKRLLSSSYDGVKKLWNLETGKEMVSLVSTGKRDWAIVTPQQYYFATKGAHKYIHFVKGMDVFPFEQFDLKFNRPDIIIKSLISANQDLIRPYNLAYKKRLKRLGFTEEMLTGEFHMPKVRITNKDDLPILTTDRSINLSLSGIDSKYKLDRLMVRVNGVPIHGAKGLDIKKSGAKLYKGDIPISLSAGVNQITVSLMNVKGVESIPANIDIEYHNPDGKRPILHLVTLGVSEYADPKFNLSYAAKDAGDLTALFKKQHLPFEEVKMINLQNEEVTVEALDWIKDSLMRSTEDDIVCVFFAGHGLLDANLDYFLAAHEVDFTNPTSGGIPYEKFEGLIEGIPARKKILMIDACHSGEIDKDEVEWAEETAEVVGGEEDITFRAVTTTTSKHLGLSNSFELMKELFSDLKKSSGAIIISSAGGTEYAMEGGSWKNGVFTYSLLKGISEKKADENYDGVIMISELNQYVHDKVIELTNGRQSPTNREENLETDFRMW